MQNKIYIWLTLGISLIVLTSAVRAQDEQWLQYHSEREARRIVGDTYDGSAMKVYYNGKVVGKLDANGALATTTEPLYIGTKHAEAPVDDELSGILDDIRIYNYALSEADIAAIYAGKELGRGKNWIPVLVIVVIAAVAAGLAIKKKKVTT